MEMGVGIFCEIKLEPGLSLVYSVVETVIGFTLRRKRPQKKIWPIIRPVYSESIIPTTPTDKDGWPTLRTFRTCWFIVEKKACRLNRRQS